MRVRKPLPQSSLLQSDILPEMLRATQNRKRQSGNKLRRCAWRMNLFPVLTTRHPKNRLDSAASPSAARRNEGLGWPEVPHVAIL